MTHRPVGAGSSFIFTAGAATTSSAFSVQSDTLRVVAVNAAAHVAIGTNPTATGTDYYIPSGQSATLALTKASNRVVGVTTGTTTIVTVPEGTQVPFGIGDYVTLTSNGQSYYNFSHAPVISVNTTSTDVLSLKDVHSPVTLSPCMLISITPTSSSVNTSLPPSPFVTSSTI